MADGKLADVEQDAIYITEKRFADQREERAREQAKHDREQAKENKLPSGGATYDPDEKKGK